MKAWKMYSALGLTALGVIGTGAVLQGCDLNIHAAEATEPYLHTALTREVHLQDGYLLEREFAGEIRAGQSSELAFELAGQVTGLLVDEGEEVKAGQLLARLDTHLLLAQRNELQAQTEELRAELDTTRRDLARIEKLRIDNMASERERDSLAGKVSVLEASLNRVAALRDANEIRLRKSELRSPFDSRIAVRHVDSGAVVNPGTPVFGLVETGRHEIRAGVPVALAETLAVGEKVDVRVGEFLTTGRVIQVGAVVNTVTQTRTVRVAQEETWKDSWTPGVIAYLRIGVEMGIAGAWLPDSAVTEGVRGTWVVYSAVPEGDGQARLEARSVVIHHADANQLFVSGSIHEGDQIVAKGLHRLAPGQLVKPQPQEFDSFADLSGVARGPARRD